jgi:hypothetical protein
MILKCDVLAVIVMLVNLFKTQENVLFAVKECVILHLLGFVYVY